MNVHAVKTNTNDDGHALRPRPLKMMPGAMGLWQTFTVVGGPWDQRPNTVLGVCVRESTGRATGRIIHLPIPDFSVPCKDDLPKVVAALKMAIIGLTRGEEVYVGCGAGRGRTGLFLALLAKVMGADNPVLYVRQNYLRHAVETAEQQRYVAEFDVGFLRWYLLEMSWRGLWRRWWGV